MPNIAFAGFVFNNAGAAIVGATVEVFDRNTTTPVRATTTTDANGYYTISHATEGRFDVRATSGSSVRFNKYDTALQLTTLEVANFRVRNPAFTFEYDIVPAAIVADRQLNLPLITATDTLMTLGLAQTVTGALTLSAVLTVNANIAFPATQVTSADANTLDDYEEGTFTPGVSFGGGTTGITYSTQLGRYVKIGNHVWVSGYVVLTNKGSSTGQARITGLPFTIVNATGAYSGLRMTFDGITYTGVIGGYAGVNAATILFESVTEAGASAVVSDVNFANGSLFRFGFDYEVA